jgi:uncharacterized membrane protein YhiD involved in acid resistance
MVIGMAVGTKFYLLAVIAAVVISLVVVLMTRFDWYARDCHPDSARPGSQRRGL